MQLALDDTQTKRSYTGSYQDYSTIYDDEDYNAPVRYQGSVMRFYELPATAYNRPWTARLATQTSIESWGLLWSNFLRYRAGYRDLARVAYEDYQGQRIGVYEDYKYPKSFTWDTVLEYAYKLPREQQAYLRVEVQNVQDRANWISGTTTAAYYEPGRTYWLEVGYRF